MNHTFFYEHKWYLLGVGTVLYASMFLYMGLDTDIYSDSPFFNVQVNGVDPLKNPHVLGVPVTTTGSFIIFMIFFFLNAFFGVWLKVLIVDRYNLLINDGSAAVKEGIVKQYPPQLFWAYNLWTSARNFFNLLGILSNIFFFVSTILGALLGNILARRFLIGLDDLEHEKENLVASNSIYRRPLTKLTKINYSLK